MADYQNLQLGSEDYFKQAYDILNEEIDKAMRKELKQSAQMFVSDFGQMPYGSSVAGQITGDIYKGGLEQKRRGGVEIALGAALPQYQAQFQAGESEKQRTFLGEQGDLDRQLREDLARWMMEYETTRAGASKVPWWQSLLSGISTGAGYYAGTKLF